MTKDEDTATADSPAAAIPVVPTTDKEGSIKTDEAEEKETEDAGAITTLPATTEPEDDEVVAAANAVAEAATEDGAVEAGTDAGEEAPMTPKRRFFPRVRHLLQPEWEYFLQGVLHALESSGAHNVANASHKASNPWYKAFHSIYGGVASDCSVPTGKNRYHKFKDKIVELWQAVDNAEAHPLKEMGVRQYNSYQLAVETKPPSSGPGGAGGGANGKIAVGTEKAGTAAAATTLEGATKTVVPKLATTVVKRPPTVAGLNKVVINTAGAAVGAAAKANNNKRSHASAVGGGPLGNLAYPPGQQWAHLDEAVALARIPQPLQSLLHLRHMGVEVQSQDTVLIEEAYQRALNDFLDTPSLLAKKETSAAAATTGAKGGRSPADLYTLCQSMVLLWRCAKRLQKSQESKAILYTYHNIVQEYLQSIQQQQQQQQADKVAPPPAPFTEI